MAENSLTLSNVIISRSRPQTITTHKVIDNSILVVPDNEVESYKYLGLEIIPIPSTIRGISKVRNWVMDNINTDVIIMFDDDITSCNCIIGPRYYRLSKNDITQLLINTALTARNLGVCSFGFNQAWDIRKYSPFEPFRLNTWIGGVVGIVSREIRWDEKLTCKCDIDYSLQNLLKKRILWVDQRHSFVQKRDKNIGGNSLYRTQDLINAERKCLKRKWGSHINFSNVKTTQRTTISVTRKQSIV